jgi:hypothetical protein
VIATSSPFPYRNSWVHGFKSLLGQHTFASLLLSWLQEQDFRFVHYTIFFHNFSRYRIIAETSRWLRPFQRASGRHLVFLIAIVVFCYRIYLSQSKLLILLRTEQLCFTPLD